MALILNLRGPSFYECDFCGDYTSRVLTDSFTDKEICFDCASTGEKGLFWTVTQSPDEEGDNLIEVATAAGRISTDDED